MFAHWVTAAAHDLLGTSRLQAPQSRFRFLRQPGVRSAAGEFLEQINRGEPGGVSLRTGDGFQYFDAPLPKRGKPENHSSNGDSLLHGGLKLLGLFVSQDAEDGH
jgi:hypothetical protein